MGKLADLAASGHSPIDPRVEQIARDKELSIEQRTDALSELLPKLDDQSKLDAESWIATLTQQRLAGEQETPE